MVDQTAILSTADVRDLRRADSLCFDTGPHVETASGSRIRAVIRGNDREGERTIVIPTGEARVRNYGTGDGPWSCFHMAMNAQHEPITQTFTRLVKTGGWVRFDWTRSNSSPVTKAAGLVVDHLDAVIHDKHGSITAVLRLHTFIGLDNSARMVRPV